MFGFLIRTDFIRVHSPLESFMMSFAWKYKTIPGPSANLWSQLLRLACLWVEVAIECWGFITTTQHTVDPLNCTFLFPCLVPQSVSSIIARIKHVCLLIEIILEDKNGRWVAIQYCLPNSHTYTRRRVSWMVMTVTPLVFVNNWEAHLSFSRFWLVR